MRHTSIVTDKPTLTADLRSAALALASDLVDSDGYSPGAAVRCAFACIAGLVEYEAEYDANDWRVDRDAPRTWQEPIMNAKAVL